MNLSKIENLSVKIKWKVLLIAILLFFVIFYRLYITKTFALLSAYKTLCEKANMNSPHAATSFAETILADTGDNYLLDSLSNFCDENNITIKEISQLYSKPIDSYIIETNKIVLEGNYQNTLECIDKIERQNKIASINAACWNMVKDKATENYTLLLTLYTKYLKHGKTK